MARSQSQSAARRRLDPLLVVQLLSLQESLEARLEAGLAVMGLTPAGFRLVGVLMGKSVV